LSDNEADYDSDDDIVGEAVYSEEYLQKRKQRRKASSSSGSEGDEEYNWNEDNVEDEEEDDEDSMSVSEESDKPRKFKRLAGRTRRETKLRSVGEIQSGLRRSKRATQKRINYRQLEMSDSETEFVKPDKSNASDDHSDPSEENGDYMMESEDSDGNDDEEQETKDVEPVTYHPAEGNNNQYPAVEENDEQSKIQPPEKSSSPGQEEVEGTTKRRFLDLNELAPSSGFDDAPNTTTTKDEGNDDL